jgi:hypothetical protein
MITLNRMERDGNHLTSSRPGERGKWKGKTRNNGRRNSPGRLWPLLSFLLRLNHPPRDEQARGRRNSRGMKACCWGSENQMLPNASGTTFLNEHAKIRKEHGGRKSRKVCSHQVANPFICALDPPLIRRRMNFYIPKLPSNLKNIPNVNAY